MNLIREKFGSIFSERIFSTLFAIWFILFPFDAAVLPVSVGFMTIYPFLVLTFLLFLYTFFAPLTVTNRKKETFVMLFFVFWVIYALCFFPFVRGKIFAFYEIRSIVLMSVTMLLMFRTYMFYGAKRFMDMLRPLSLFVFLMLTFVAFFEFFTGIHFSGSHTVKLYNLVPGNVTYSPVFLYDNPNSFLVYLIGSALLVMLTNINISRSPFKILMIIFVIFFFSFLADSRFGKLISLLFFCYFIFVAFPSLSAFSKYVFKRTWLLVAAVSMLLVILSHEIYLGPMWKDREHYLVPSIHPVEIENGQLKFYPADSLVKIFGEEELCAKFREFQMRDVDNSGNIRKNLVLNGFFLLKYSHFMGVGPGQYRWFHDNNKVPYEVTTLNSPHNGPVEIFSQYGIFIFIGYVMIFVVYWLNAFRSRKNSKEYFSLISLSMLAFYILSAMPSAWLILNMAWILMPVICIASSQLCTISNDRS